jgi:hypothetical protein
MGQKPDYKLAHCRDKMESYRSIIRSRTFSIMSRVAPDCLDRVDCSHGCLEVAICAIASAIIVRSFLLSPRHTELGGFKVMNGKPKLAVSGFSLIVDHIEHVCLSRSRASEWNAISIASAADSAESGLLFSSTIFRALDLSNR